MDDAFLKYYEHELDQLRHSASRFAEEFPKIARRLQLSDQECADPYVERLLEGTAYLTARIAKKLDDGSSEFPETLLNQIAPEINAPLPSRSIIRLKPGKPACLPLGTPFSVPTGLPGDPRCIYTLREPLNSSGLQMTDFSYEDGSLSSPGSAADMTGVQGALRCRVLCSEGSPEPVRLFINLPLSASGELLRLLMTECAGIRIRCGGQETALSADSLSECSLPPSPCRLCHTAEYFLLAEQASFFCVSGLRRALPEQGEAELLLLLRREPSERLRLLLHQDSVFLTDCARVINAFPHRLSRIIPSWREYEHAVGDATAAGNYEVLQIEKGAAYSVDNRKLFDIYPFYFASDVTMPEERVRLNYFSLRREQPVAPHRTRMSPYIGSEVYLQISGPLYSALRESVHSYSLQGICSNRDLPLFVRKDSTLSSGEYTASFVTAPTHPQPPLMQDAARWVGMTLARLTPGTLASVAPESLPALVRALLDHLHTPGNRAAEHCVRGLEGMQLRSCTRTIPVMGDLCVMRGWHVDVTLNEQAYSGQDVYLFARSLAEDILQMGEVNTYTEVSIRTSEHHLNTWQRQQTDM